MFVVENFVKRGIVASRVVVAAAVLCGCGTNQPDSDISSTKNYTDPLPEPPDNVSNAADAVVFGRVVSSASFDVPTSETAVQTFSVVAIDWVERGNLRPGDEVVVVTNDGKTDDRNTNASHGAHPTTGLEGRFYLTAAAPDNPAFSNAAAADAVRLRSGYVFTVTGGFEGLQVPHAAMASTTCTFPFDVPGNGYCTLGTLPWKPSDPKAVFKYWVNPTTAFLTPGQAVMAIQSGLAAWNDEPSAWARFEYQGTTPLQSDGTKNIFAFTTDCGGPRGYTDRVFDGNYRIYHFTTCLNENVPGGWTFHNAMHTAMHEAGHALGLEHVEDITQVMHPGLNNEVYLGSGDRNFLHDHYRGPEIPTRGDFNGDGAPDLVSFTNQATSSSASVSVALKNTSNYSFMPATTWNSSFAPKGETPLVGNFDGDAGHKDDIASFARQETGVVTVCLSNGSSFPSAQCKTWSSGWLTRTIHPEVGDVNHDGKADMVGFSTDGSGDVRVSLSDGTKFGTPTVWHTYFGVGGEWTGIADVNQDGCADIVTMLNGAGAGMSKKVYVALSQACLPTNKQNKFGSSQVWMPSFCGPNKTPSVTSTGLSCVSLDGSSWTVAPVNATKTGFDPEVQWGGTGGPVFNQTAFTYAHVYPYLVWFEHGSRAHGYARAAGGAPIQIYNVFAPGPCPWNGVSGVCP